VMGPLKNAMSGARTSRVPVSSQVKSLFCLIIRNYVYTHADKAVKMIMYYKLKTFVSFDQF
jgi:hypothetical protein